MGGVFVRSVGLCGSLALSALIKKGFPISPFHLILGGRDGVRGHCKWGELRERKLSAKVRWVRRMKSDKKPSPTVRGGYGRGVRTKRRLVRQPSSLRKKGWRNRHPFLRRERDSNPRAPELETNSFRDCRIRPLCHLSERVAKIRNIF